MANKTEVGASSAENYLPNNTQIFNCIRLVRDQYRRPIAVFSIFFLSDTQKYSFLALVICRYSFSHPLAKSA